MTTENTNPIASGPMTPLQLNVSDIEIAVKAIDVAADQGAYRGWQMITDVLVLRNRLVEFLKSLPVPPAPEGDEIPESPATEGTV